MTHRLLYVVAATALLAYAPPAPAEELKDPIAVGNIQQIMKAPTAAQPVRAFRSKATEVQKEVQSKKALLDNAFERSLGDIQKAVTDIIAEMSKEKGFAVAIPTSQILYADNRLDISAEVLTRLNKKLPKIDVKFDR